MIVGVGVLTTVGENAAETVVGVGAGVGVGVGVAEFSNASNVAETAALIRLASTVPAIAIASAAAN